MRSTRRSRRRSCGTRRSGRSSRTSSWTATLVYDWLWVAGSWDRVGPAARAAREKAGVPELFANFEELAQGQS